MRVLFVIPRLISYQTFLRDLAAALSADGVEVHVACSLESLFDRADENRADAFVQFHGIPFPRGMNPLAHMRAGRALDALVARVRPDIVHAHFSTCVFTTALARRRHWPVTFGTFHGLSFPLVEGRCARLLRVAESCAATRCDTAWVLTADDRAALAAAAPRAHVEVTRSCGLGCDLQKFSPSSDAERSSLRSQLGLTGDACVFVFIGRFVEFKGFDLAVRAFLRIAESRPELRLLLVGARDPLHPSGLSTDEEQACRASRQIVDAGFQRDVRPYLGAADVMVFPSRREGFPVCLMESLASGVPVITRDTRGCREVVRHGSDGLVLRRCSVETVGAAMLCLAEDPALRRKFSAAAVARRQRFDRQHFIREQTEIYRRHSPDQCDVLQEAGAAL